MCLWKLAESRRRSPAGVIRGRINRYLGCCIFPLYDQIFSVIFSAFHHSFNDSVV